MTSRALAPLVFASFCLVAIASQVGGTPLDDYVNLPDPTYKYEYLNVSYSLDGYDAYLYNMTSQTWMDKSFTDEPVWWHFMAILIPKIINRRYDTAFMFIAGGGIKNWYPSSDNGDLQLIGEIAVMLQTPAAVLWQVPNQPVTFPGDPFPGFQRDEDEVIAYTWWRYLLAPTPNPFWVLELPMTKAGVRGLDTLQAILPQYTGVPVNRFYVAGGSKRGWTTWLVGAVDKRVAAIIPMVLDALNVPVFLERQVEYYGAWTFALFDYWQMNVTAMFTGPRFAEMMSFIDPYQLRSRLTMPKMAMNSVGDEFMMPDDQRFWAPDMPGEMNLVMLNARHNMQNALGNVVSAVASFLQSLNAGSARPRIQWKIDPVSGAIVVRTNRQPILARIMWSDSYGGVSAGRRDFRWTALNVSPCPRQMGNGLCDRQRDWTYINASHVGGNTFVATMPLPAPGFWRGFFMELQWANPYGGPNFILTSPTSVIPNTRPFPQCSGSSCQQLPLC